MSRLVSFVVLVAILLVIGGLFFQVMASFLLPLFLAVLLVVMFRPLHNWFVARCQGRNRLAAALTTLAILAIVLAPFLWILVQAAGEAAELVGGWNQQTARMKFEKLRRRVGLALPPGEVREKLSEIEQTLDGWSEEKVDAAQLPAQRDRLLALVDEVERALADARQAGEPESTVPPPSLWQAQLERLRSQLGDLQRVGAGGDEFFVEVAEAQQAYVEFNQALLGGPLAAWLKRQANPDREQVLAARQRLKEFAGPLALGGAQFAGHILVELLVGLAIMVVALYYFLADGPAMIGTLMRLSPLDDRYERELLNEFTTVSRAVVVATLLSACVQGLLAGAGYFFAGLDSIFLLIMLTMLLALIPFVGATAVWLPCSLWLFLYEERPMAAVMLALYGALVVSMADNIIKPLVLQGRSNLHPLLALLSVLGGVKAMGPIGIVVGPMVVAFLQPLLKMLEIELRAMSAPAASAAAVSPPP